MGRSGVVGGTLHLPWLDVGFGFGLLGVGVVVETQMLRFFSGFVLSMNFSVDSWIWLRKASL